MGQNCLVPFISLNLHNLAPSDHQGNRMGYGIITNTGGDPISTLLRNCATDSSKFFLLTSASEIVTTFNQIGTALSNLRVAK